MRWLWASAWWLSETTGIGLGWLAPFVFGQMLGQPGKRIR